MRPTCLVALALLVAAFVAFYPYLSGMGPCYGGECPYATHSSSEGSNTGFATACVGAGLVASSVAVLAFAVRRGCLATTDDPRPTEVYFSLEPPPPRLPLTR